jgi:hypothetical protein
LIPSDEVNAPVQVNPVFASHLTVHPVYFDIDPNPVEDGNYEVPVALSPTYSGTGNMRVTVDHQNYVSLPAPATYSLFDVSASSSLS